MKIRGLLRRWVGSEEVRAARGAPSTRGAAGIDNLHMWNMSLTCPTSHWDTSPLNDVAPPTVTEVVEWARR